MALTHRPVSEPAGAFTTLDGEDCYRISGYDRMPAFLMSIPSASDLWMFLASSGGLTAGRVSPDGSLFPYETVDRLADAHHHTGPITLVRVTRGDGTSVLWQPFSEGSDEGFRIERNLYKNTIGNRVHFEEINHDLGLAFRYRWSASDEFGLVRTATLSNLGPARAPLALLDGLRNLLPSGAPLALYQQSSCLVDAYKRADCDPQTRLATFSLTAKILDRAEAAEELHASTAWCHGLGNFEVHLSLAAIAAFRNGNPVPAERLLTGRRGNYLVTSARTLEPGASVRWHIAADVGRSHIQVAALRARLLAGEDLERAIDRSLDEAGEDLRRIVASADGLQLTARRENDTHHFANVLFNNMRGGIFAANYDVPAPDFRDFLETRNRAVVVRHGVFLANLPATIRSADLIRAARDTGDADLERLSHEYLPLYFGRRHGDPSRPWNRFAIHVHDKDGNRALRYEGNWRDIFQNWEALSLSFPGFLPGIIAKFVNASTVDGFNPYRITRDGIDWEVIEPHHPWSHIGYWGDHQIVYLLRFLEALEHHAPGELAQQLERAIYSYADVPYRLRPYAAMVEDPHSTIDFAADLATRIHARVEDLGTDGKLVTDSDGRIRHVNLLEKLMVPALCKLSNLVPDAGIWMNTQRPEWNDANNALVGNGASIVTLCYLRRYLHFLGRLVADPGGRTTAMSSEVVVWLRQTAVILERWRPVLERPALADLDRKRLLDELGEAFSSYREAVYGSGFSGRTELPVQEIAALCERALEYLDHAIHANRREDGLYHSYNLITLERERGEIRVQRMDEMLEGQVAVLSSGVIDAAEAVRLVEQLFASRLYREDQASFLLYPEKALPGFLEKNVVPAASVDGVPLLSALIAARDGSILAQDALGVFRFHADFRNARDLDAALDRLAGEERWMSSVARDRHAVLEVFEEVFHHRSYTGRSGTMYGYEGLGCIYWHMVAKLLLAVQEVAFQAARAGEPAPIRRALAQLEARIRGGLGFAKTPARFGAFPMDPYSRTPRHAGAQQPGMTGQVKEEILTRFGELGVEVEAGLVRFRPTLLERGEFLAEPGAYRYYDLQGRETTIDVMPGSLAFSFCQVPVIYERTREEAWIRVTRKDGSSTDRSGDQLDAAESAALFDRSGTVVRIEVGVPEQCLIAR